MQHGAMTRSDVDAIRAALPGACYLSHKDGGLDAWKVRDKMFAGFGHAGDGMSVKCADVDGAQFLIGIGAAQKTRCLNRARLRAPFAD